MMSDDTEVKPMSAEGASEIRYCGGLNNREREQVQAIADGRHEVIDRATHAKVTHEELERLRACEADARRLDLIESEFLDVTWESVPTGGDDYEVHCVVSEPTTQSESREIARCNQENVRAAIDAAQQEGSSDA